MLNAGWFSTINLACAPFLSFYCRSSSYSPSRLVEHATHGGMDVHGR